MKDDLDRVLEGLGKVEVPPGLEGRVLRGLEGPRARGFAWGWVGLVAVVLAGVLVGGFELRDVKTTGVARTIPPAQETRTQTVVAEKVRTVEANKLRRDSSTAFVAKSATNSAQNGVVSGTAIAEGGFPAPAEGLTEQERLLLRLAARPTPRTLVVFNVKLREDRAAVAKAEFDEFFKPVVVLATTEPDPDLRVANPAGKEEKKDDALVEKR